MSKPLGLLARAVVISAALAVVAAPGALAQEVTTEPEVPTTAEVAPPTSATEASTTSTTSTPEVTTTESVPTSSTAPTTSARTTTSQKPPTTVSTTSSVTTSAPDEQPLEDQLVFVVDEEHSAAYVIIVCDGHKPTDVHSDVLDIDPLEQHPMYEQVWGALAYLREDATLGMHTVSAKCGDTTLSAQFEVVAGMTEEPAPQGSPAPVLDKPVNDKPVLDKGKAVDARTKPVRFTPVGGVETGFGGTAG